MDGCKHKNCGSGEKIWLPYIYRGRVRGLKPHPYCIHCGSVKNLSSEKPKDIGYYMNLIGSLGNRYKIAKVQMRLIALEMIKEHVSDDYALDRHQQEKLFLKIVRRNLNISERELQELLDSEVSL
ncbi:MAG TPA: hypothetical protein VLY86_03900 [Methanothrix sp.]|nr:hypothetical protein [Methanothrix sp.]